MGKFDITIGDSGISGDFSKLEKLIEGLEKGIFVDIGIMGAGSFEGGATIAAIGAVHEFGTDRAGRDNDIVIPERSWLRMPLETGQEDIEDAVKPHLAKKLAEGDTEGIFELIGIAGEARIQEAFETGGFGDWPANAPSTIAQKGSSAPLIDDGTFRKSITSKVGGGK